MKIVLQCFSYFILSALVFVQTFWLAPDAWADEFKKASQDGQQLGSSVTPNPDSLFSATGNGNITLFPGSENSTPVNMNELFPTQDGNQNINELKASAGNNGEILSLGHNANSALATEESLTGEAYRTVVGSAGIYRPNMTNDPVFRQTDQVVGNLANLKAEFSDCTETTNFVAAENSVHVPDYQFCEKVFKQEPQTCKMSQTFEATSGSFTVKGGIKYGIWAYIEFDLVQGTASKFEGTDNAPAFAAELSTKLDFNKICKSGNTHFEYVQSYHWDNAPSSIKNKNDTSVSRNVIQMPSCENGLKGVVLVNDTDTSRAGPDDWDVNGVWEFRYTNTRPTNTWLPKSCVDLFYKANDKFCDTDWQITAGATNMDDCLSIAGSTICPGTPAAAGFNYELPDLPMFATEVKVTANGCDFNIGELTPYTDINGDLQTPVNDGSNPDSCGELETNPSCAYVSETCVEGATGEVSGTCYIKEIKYDCGYDVGYDTIQKQTELQCAGPIRCMGEDCVEVQRTASADFSKAAASLQAAKFIGMDANCDENGNCKVFEGKGGSCKKAVGGYVDCCKKPEGLTVSVGDYVRLASAVGQLNDAVMTLEQGNAVRGAWQTLSDPFTSAWGEINNTFTSGWESMWGGTESLTDAGAEAASAGVKQALMNETAQWTANLFGEGAANMLFSNAANQGAAVVGGEVTGNVALGGGQAIVGTMLAWIMVAYTIYVVVTILIKMIYKCEQPEFELAMKRELKSCHYVGSYCSQELDLWFKKFCIERKTSYCCFSSPISRILQEQIRPQLGMGWGNAKSPSCGGIPTERLEEVDWEQVNLDEWIGLLGANNLLPTTDNLNLERLTGTGSLLDTEGDRKNAAERTIDRMNGMDTTGIRQQARDELQGSVLFEQE